MFFNQHILTTALHSKLNGSLADQWLQAASQVNIGCLAEELRLLDSDELAARFIELDLRTQKALLGVFCPEVLSELLIALRPITRRRVLSLMSLAELAQVFGRLPWSVQACALRRLNSAKQKRFWILRRRLHRPFDYDARASQLRLDTKVSDAVAHYHSQAHENHYLYVVDEHQQLCGVLYGQALSAITVKDAPIGLYMEQPKELIVMQHDRDYVVERLRRYHTLELPVVDEQRRLLGVVDIDDLE